MGNYANHIVVCGYEQGMHLLLEALLGEHDTEENKIVVFADDDRPSDVPPELYWIRGDATKESELDKARIVQASTVIVTGSRRVKPQQADATSILTVFTIRSRLTKSPAAKNRKKPVRIIAEILDSENVQHARAAGSDEVVETRRVGYALLAHTVVYPGVADATSRMVFDGNQNLYVGLLPGEIDAPTTFDRLSQQVRASTGCLVIGFRDPETGEEQVNPGGDEMVMPGVELLYLAPEPRLASS